MSNANSKGTGEIDPIDLAAIVIVPFVGGMVFEAWSLEISVFGGYDLHQALFEFGGAAFSPAFLVTVAGALWIFGSNRMMNKEEMPAEEFGALAVALALPIAYEFMPVVQDLLALHDILRLAAALVLSVAVAYISWVR